jgi:hypothetical protein
MVKLSFKGHIINPGPDYLIVTKSSTLIHSGRACDLCGGSKVHEIDYSNALVKCENCIDGIEGPGRWEVRDEDTKTV